MLVAEANIELREASYKLLEPLDYGGENEFWMAEGPEGRIVALKTVLRDGDETLVEMRSQQIAEEISFLAGLPDPESYFLLPCLDAGSWHDDRFGELPAYVTPLPAGSLKQMAVAPDGETLMRWMGQICHALTHLAGKIDLNPEAIMLTGVLDGDVLLCPRFNPDQDEPPPVFVSPDQQATVQLHGGGGTGGNAFRSTVVGDIHRLGRLLYWLVCGEDEAQEGSADSPNATMVLSRPKIGMLSAGILPELVDGLTPRKMQRFRQALEGLFGSTPDATLVVGGGRTLPDAGFNAGRLSSWLQRMLSPSPALRPMPADAEAVFANIYRALQPGIETVALRIAPAQVEVGGELDIELTIRGEGLPAHGNWLSFTLDGKPLTLKAESPRGDYVNGKGIWRYRWTPNDGDEGERLLAVRYTIDGRQGGEEALFLVIEQPAWRRAERESDDIGRNVSGELSEQPSGGSRLAGGIGRIKSSLMGRLGRGPNEQELANVHREISRRGDSLRGRVVGYVKDPRNNEILGLVTDEEPLIVGRDAGAGLVLASDAVSGEHLRLGWDRQAGKLWIEDLGSSNGTWWGKGKRLTPGHRYPLKSGKIFYLADESVGLRGVVYSDDDV